MLFFFSYTNCVRWLAGHSKPNCMANETKEEKKEEEKVWTNYKVENFTKACVRRKRHESYGACECHAALTSMGDCGSAGQAAVSAYRKHQIREDN